ncbi:MAG: hypothetical protein ACR2FN_08955 [Chitinophagaceae bacterium]
MELENFFILQKNEVQDFAKEILNRELTESEYYDVKKMFEFGIETWGEVLRIAIEERCDKSFINY